MFGPQTSALYAVLTYGRVPESILNCNLTSVTHRPAELNEQHQATTFQVGNSQHPCPHHTLLPQLVELGHDSAK